MNSENSHDVARRAWQLFQSGDLNGAERAAVNAAHLADSMEHTPLPDILIIKAFYLARLQRFAEARELFGRVLEQKPDDSYAQQGYLLSLKDQFSISAGPAVLGQDPGSGRYGKLLLGIGTGRSGSTTLARLWSMQDSCYCAHEHPPRLPWKGDIQRLDFHCRRFDLLAAKFRFVGDVSHWWLPFLETLWRRYPELRVIVLKRDRDATVRSFLRVKGGERKGALHHWVEHDGTYWRRNPWDECYPKYSSPRMDDALMQYWTDYYDCADMLAQRRPGQIKVVATEKLGEITTQRSLLEFCGFESPVTLENLHLNKDHARDGVHMY